VVNPSSNSRSRNAATRGDIGFAAVVGGENGFNGDEGEVREVFVIDRVELVLAHQPQQVGEFEGNHAVRFEQRAHATDKIVEIGHLGEHIVAGDEVGAPLFGDNPLCLGAAEKSDPSPDSLLNRHRGDVRGRFNAQNGNPAGDEVAEQIAIVTGQLDDRASRTQVESLDHLIGVVPGVLEPGFRV